MQEGSKTQLNQNDHNQSIQNSEIQELQASSKHSQNKNWHVRSHRLADVHSEVLNRRQRSLESPDYKRSLLKLMIVVKLEGYGYKQADLNGMIDFQMANIEDMESIEGKDLDLKATEIALRIISGLFGEVNAQMPRFMGQSSSSQSRVMPLEMNLEVIPVQRMDEMAFVQPERQLPEILCNICYIMSSSYCEEQCGHAFCLDCMKGYLRENLRSGNYIIKCPEYDCPEHISLEIVKMALNQKQFERFLYFKDKNEKEMNPDNKFCSKPDCGELLDKANDRLKCKKCDSAYCQICLQNFHYENPCDIVLRNSIENTYKSFQIKKCPSCKSPIEKSEGCNHMTCKKCKFQFCWLCLKKYSRHHYKYYNCFGCPGMQFEDEDQVVAQRFKQLLLYLLMPFILTLLLFCYLAAVPLYMLGCFVYKPCAWADSDKEFLEDQIVRNVCCCLNACTSKLLLWVLYQPRAMLYSVFLSPIKLTMMFCGQLCKIFQ